MMHPGMFLSGLWIVFIGVVSGWVVKYVTTNAALRRYLRVSSGMTWASLALACLVFSFFGLNAVVHTASAVAVASGLVFVPLVLYAGIRYPTPIELRWTVRKWWAQRRGRKRP